MLAEVGLSVKVLVKVLAILSKKVLVEVYWQYFSKEVSISVLAILSKSIVNNLNDTTIIDICTCTHKIYTTAYIHTQTTPICVYKRINKYAPMHVCAPITVKKIIV